jgi:hypothetical protein
VSFGESFGAKSPMSLEATLLLLWQGHPLASSQDESAQSLHWRKTGMSSFQV